MDIQVNGKQMDVGEALRTHVQQHLEDLTTKYFEQALDANVVMTKEGHRFRSDITVHAGRGVTVQATAETGDAHSAYEAAADRIGKQLRRWKRRLTDYRSKGSEAEAVFPAQAYILAAPEDEGEEAFPEADSPVVVADMPTEIPTCTVSHAVMRMDLADLPAMMFHNSAHGRLNVVYRRPDGNIGWIDPQEG